MNKNCKNCAFFLLIVFSVIFVIGCGQVVKSVDYYNECLNDPVCSDEIRQTNQVASSLIASSVDTHVNNSPVAELIGGAVASMISFGLGVVRGKQIKKRG